MSRLKRKLLNSLNYLNYLEKKAKLVSSSRLLYKRVLASWEPVNIKGPELLKVLTDAMTYNSTIRINYKNSGWRSILPYGWNTSQDGNILVMCYKDTGEIRSYRLDRIFDLLIGDDLSRNLNQNNDESLTWEDFQMPTLPNINDIIKETEEESEETLPYDDALKALTTNKVIKEEPTEYQDGEDLSDIDNLNINEQDVKDDNNNNAEDEDRNEDDNNEENDKNEEKDKSEEENDDSNEDEKELNLDDLDFDFDDLDLDEEDKKSKDKKGEDK